MFLLCDSVDTSFCLHVNNKPLNGYLISNEKKVDKSLPSRLVITYLWLWLPLWRGKILIWAKASDNNIVVCHLLLLEETSTVWTQAWRAMQTVTCHALASQLSSWSCVLSICIWDSKPSAWVRATISSCSGSIIALKCTNNKDKKNNKKTDILSVNNAKCSVKEVPLFDARESYSCVKRDWNSNRGSSKLKTKVSL